MEQETMDPGEETEGRGAPSRWPWTRSLAMAGEGTLLEVEEILFGRTDAYCRRLGIRPGSRLVCMKNDQDGVEVSLPGNRTSRLERDYAWFVLVRLG